MLIVRNLNLKNLSRSLVLKELELVSGGTVESLLGLLAVDLALDADKIDLVYRGEILNRDANIDEIVEHANRKVLMLLAERQADPIIATGDKPTSQELQSVSNHINKIYKSKTRRVILEKLLRNTNELLRVLGSIPGLTADPVALSFVQNFDLIKLFADPTKSDNFSSNANIFRGVKLIVDFVREKSRHPDQTTSQFVSKASYSIDDMSEDEDERSGGGNIMAPRGSQHQQQQQANRPVLTQDYLASVLASIGRTGAVNQPAASTSATPAPAAAAATSNPAVATPIVPSNPSQQRGGISMEFFQNVMQQILPPQQQQQSNSARTAAPQPTPQPPQPTSAQQQEASMSDADLATKLEQMHELGLFDDETNLRALQMTGGNVEAAVSLILEGGLE